MGVHQVATTVRVVGPDGSVRETRVDDEGRAVVSEVGPDGLETHRLISEFAENGVFSRLQQVGDGPTEALDPISETKRINSYGSTAEHLEYADGVTVERSFDDDGRLRSTEVAAGWGDLTMRVRADGGRTLTWESTFHTGSRTWDAGGREVSYEVEFSDGTAYQRELIDDMVRVRQIDRDGQSSVSEISAPGGG